ncbi:apolipoprotein N-acyltransferase [Gaoshiqia sediminis]|uniref:Apolipoprotein N-acyltransferase n=1 Tax=Gaoshiqia sediminis TaxID=2986998 RepID=A0AA41Y8Y4_9BACT|nr:apolipoprotein N-acyltransferase [Gaoshiqia sediminis]MCW0481390.1 apolipoprotein N-acyltransferase [Gaoshiqia sediminis]
MKNSQLILLAAFSAILLALPWLGFMPGWILFVAFLPLMIVEDHIFQQRKTESSIAFFGYAYLSFWLWNALSTWWIVHSTLAGGVLIVFLNATFMAGVWWLFHLMKRRFHIRTANLSLVTFWISFEYLHFNWEIAWPWLSLGNGFANQVKLIQWYEYTGVFGGTLWILIMNLLFFQVYKYISVKGFKWVIPQLTWLTIAMALPIIYSMRQYHDYRETGRGCEIVILQPNIDPYLEKFSGMSQEKQLSLLVNLADSLTTASTEYVVGPETALHLLDENDKILHHPYINPLRQRTQHSPHLNYIMGATTRKIFDPVDKIPPTARKFENDSVQYYDLYNAALLINQGDSIQTYHKSILVSGVEKMPFAKYLTFLENYIIDLGGTTGSLGTQPEPTNFKSAEGDQVAPIICFESVFGAYVTEFTKKGAGLIVIITNDGWWKNTPGHRQHLSFARLRAIETRRGIARSANTGISAFINQRGEIIQQTSWWERTALRGTLNLNNQLTFYVRFGDYIARISSFLSVLLLLLLLANLRMGKLKK